MKSIIIEKLKTIVQNLNKTPTGVEFYSISGFSKRTIIKYFRYI